MASTFTKALLSASADGSAIKVAAAATPGTLAHAVGGTAGVIDEVWLYAVNTDAAADHVLTIEYGGPTAPDKQIPITIPKRSGLLLVVPGLPLLGGSGATVKAFADAANVINLLGFVNRITP